MHFFQFDKKCKANQTFHFFYMKDLWGGMNYR